MSQWMICQCKNAIISRFFVTQFKQYVPLFSISGSLCKHSLSGNSLTECIWCLPARVKLWTLLKHFFSLITCIFFNIMDYLDFYCFCTLFCQFNIGDICSFIHFVAFVFLLNLDFCFCFLSFHSQLGFHLRFLRCDRSTEDKGVFSNPTVLFA